MAGLVLFRQGVKDDARKLASSVTPEILSSPGDLEDFLTEMVVALAQKHLISKGRVRQTPTLMIRRYVSGMARR